LPGNSLALAVAFQTKPDRPVYTKIKLKKAAPISGTAFLLTAYGSDDYNVNLEALF
jgi:hypothetical protein